MKPVTFPPGTTPLTVLTKVNNALNNTNTGEEYKVNVSSAGRNQPWSEKVTVKTKDYDWANWSKSLNKIVKLWNTALYKFSAVIMDGTKVEEVKLLEVDAQSDPPVCYFIADESEYPNMANIKKKISESALHLKQ